MYILYIYIYIYICTYVKFEWQGPGGPGLSLTTSPRAGSSRAGDPTPHLLSSTQRDPDTK